MYLYTVSFKDMKFHDLKIVSHKSIIFVMDNIRRACHYTGRDPLDIIEISIDDIIDGDLIPHSVDRIIDDNSADEDRDITGFLCHACQYRFEKYDGQMKDNYPLCPNCRECLDDDNAEYITESEYKRMQVETIIDSTIKE